MNEKLEPIGKYHGDFTVGELAAYLKANPGPQRIASDMIAEYVGTWPYIDDWSENETR